MRPKNVVVLISQSFVCTVSRHWPRPARSAFFHKDNVRFGGLFWRNDGADALKQQPRLFRQNRSASEYIIWHNAHSPANKCSGCSNLCTWWRKKCRLITLMQRSEDRFRFLLPYQPSMTGLEWTHKCSKRNSVINHGQQCNVTYRKPGQDLPGSNPVVSHFFTLII